MDSKLLPRATVKNLAARSNLWGAWLTCHVWGVIIGSICLFIAFPNAFTFVFAFMMVGSRQHGMAILMHEAAHGVLFKSRKINDLVGEYVLAAPYGGNMKTYRQYHLKHHRHTQTANDPDLPLSAKFPVSRSSLRRKFFRDLTGQTFLRLRLAKFKNQSLEGSEAFEGANDKISANPVIWINLGLLTLFTLAGHWWIYFALWLAPLMTWFMAVLRLRNIAEHALTEENGNPLRHARTTQANLLARIFLAPYWVNYHVEHHAYMFVPCFNLPKLHKALIYEGHESHMMKAPSYSQVLTQVALN
ncbi:fatty acid desaturase [Litorimonas taeanensis]|uniref:Fatty acid desaturase n=1 Tax=Litorimonas taeanensis TaxID=568099 RepID=A0A420WJW7_9PROT|nr:fatty acid desaturase family protein [Litorimonas taeanensis]RKQ71310.1 fatty acid desaturase [Litorimonas taeanensis]